MVVETFEMIKKGSFYLIMMESNGECDRISSVIS